MKRTIVILFLLFLFISGCAAPEKAAVPAQAEPAVHTETEALHGDRSAQLESVYDENNTLTRTQITEYHENGNTAVTTVTDYSEDGAVTFYQEKQYTEDGAAAASLAKYYDAGGALTEQTEVIYWENGQAETVKKCVFSTSGTLLERRSSSFFDDGSLWARKTEVLDEHTGFRIIRQEAYHKNGVLSLLCDGSFHPDTYELLDGRRERYSAGGVLTELESVSWDEENRVRSGEYLCYADDGAVLSSEHSTLYYDNLGRIIAREYIAYEENHVLFTHFIENCTYDGAGNMAGKGVQYYLEDSVPGERFDHTYSYSETGDLLREETDHYLASGKRQNRAVTEYGYDNAGNLIRETQTAFNDSDVQQFQTTKEYDARGNIVTFVTVSKKGSRYTETFTYDEDGRIKTELLTTQPVTTSRISYQENTYEYYENGNVKTLTVHTWTSVDESRAGANANKNDLGKTTVTEYDEEGNKI